MEVQTINPSIQKQIEKTFHLQQGHAPKIARSSWKERIQKLDRIKQYLEDEANIRRLAEALQKDFRKPETEVLVTEIAVVQSHIRHIKKNLRRWMKPRSITTPLPLTGTSSYLLCEPKGVCLIMAPWNYPLNLALMPLTYAIAAGNTVMLKPSEISGHTSRYIRQMIGELFEEREIAVFEGDASVAQALLEQPFNHIFFTGSPQIGKVVMKAAAKHLASVTLELGGKSPAIVDETADLKTVAERTVWGKCLNTGQTCIAPDYMILQEKIAGDFTAHYKNFVKKFYDPDGAGIRRSPDYPRIISPNHFHRLKRLFDDAVEKGADVAFGGEFDESENYISPTLLTNVTEEMDIMQEEIFGPIMPVLTYREKEEVIEIVRRRPKPLTLYISSRSRKNTQYFIENTSAGGTVINEYLLGYSNPNLPFGGVNNSGIGKSMGLHGFIEFSNERGIIKRHFGTMKFLYPPYSEGVRRIAKLLSRWM